MAKIRNGEVEIAIYAALFGNLVIAIFKLVAAINTGSSGLLAETAHSFADSGNQLILLIGIRLALRPPDRSHPFGYGKDRYFWTFLAAVSMFTIGATFSVYQGIQSLTGHEEVTQSAFSYAVLGVAAVLEIAALSLALKATWPEIRRRGLWKAIRETKDPTRFIVVLEDSAALLGILLAATGLVLVQLLGLAFFDGVAAILIGLLLGAVAIILGLESRSLLLGEAVHPAIRRRLISAVEGHASVQSLVDLQTMHLGPDEVLVGIEVHLLDELNTDALEQVVNEIETAVREIIPQADHLFVEAKQPDGA
jgi:cation diffusion facilitator family transporter